MTDTPAPAPVTIATTPTPGKSVDPKLLIGAGLVGLALGVFIGQKLGRMLTPRARPTRPAPSTR